MRGMVWIDSFSACDSMSVVLRPSGSNRVMRGGSFDNDDDNLRASNRNDDNPSDDNDNLGFRCASPRRRQKDRFHGFDPRACCGHVRKTGAGFTPDEDQVPGRGVIMAPRAVPPRRTCKNSVPHNQSIIRKTIL